MVTLTFFQPGLNAIGFLTQRTLRYAKVGQTEKDTSAILRVLCV